MIYWGPRIRAFLPSLLNNEYCTPFLRVSPATVPPERAPTVAGGHLRRSGTSASDAPPLRRRNVMPLAMRPLREQTAHCRRTPVLPSALTRSPPVAAPTPNKSASDRGEFVFVTLLFQEFSNVGTRPCSRRRIETARGRGKSILSRYTPTQNQKRTLGDGAK